MLKMSHVLLTTVLAMSAVLPARSKAQTTGAVFVMTNAANNNQIVAYKRNSDGSLGEGRTFATGGRGSGGVTDPLGSQGALTLNEKHTLLFAVNAGSGNISVFQVRGANLNLLETVPCGGSEPVAVAEHGSLVYVVNAGGAACLSFTAGWQHCAHCQNRGQQDMGHLQHGMLLRVRQIMRASDFGTTLPDMAVPG